jgi:hypothetical protein
LRQREATETHARVKPLYVRKEEAAAKAAAEEEARRAKMLQDNRQKYQPVEFLSEDVVLPEVLYEQAPEGAHRLASRPAPKPATRGPAPTTALPPIHGYYKGNARLRVVQELKEKRNGVQVRPEAARFPRGA